MKADRRHELQENTLAHILSNFPLYLSVYGGRILMFLTLIILVFVLVRFRNTSKVQQAEITRVSLASARESIMQIGALGGGMGAPAETANRRALLFTEANTQLDQSLNNADTDALKAEAAVARGDLYWAMANLPDLPGATTQPALALPEKRDAALGKAQEAYQSVVSTYPNEKSARATALLGLGAVAENLGKFDLAKERYEEVKASDLADLYKFLAEQKLAMLPLISKPRRLVAATQPAAGQPSGAPFISLPNNLPVEAPAPRSPTTMPSAPTTAPIGL